MTKATSTQFESLKEKMIKRGASTEYLTPEVLNIILNDRIKAAEISLKNGNISSFYKKVRQLRRIFIKRTHMLIVYYWKFWVLCKQNI